MKTSRRLWELSAQSSNGRTVDGHGGDRPLLFRTINKTVILCEFVCVEVTNIEPKTERRTENRSVLFGLAMAATGATMLHNTTCSCVRQHVISPICTTISVFFALPQPDSFGRIARSRQTARQHTRNEPCCGPWRFSRRARIVCTSGHTVVDSDLTIYPRPGCALTYTHTHGRKSERTNGLKCALVGVVLIR